MGESICVSRKIGDHLHALCFDGAAKDITAETLVTYTIDGKDVGTKVSLQTIAKAYDAEVSDIFITGCGFPLEALIGQHGSGNEGEGALLRTVSHLANEDASVVDGAITALGNIRNQVRSEDGLADLALAALTTQGKGLYATKEGHRLAAVGAVVSLGKNNPHLQASVVEELKGVMDTETSLKVRLAAIAAIGTFPTPKAFDVLAGALTGGAYAPVAADSVDPSAAAQKLATRYALINAIGLTRQPQAVAVLTSKGVGVNDPYNKMTDPNPRLTAVAAILQITGKGAYEALLRIKNDDTQPQLVQLAALTAALQLASTGLDQPLPGEVVKTDTAPRGRTPPKKAAQTVW